MTQSVLSTTSPVVPARDWAWNLAVVVDRLPTWARKLAFFCTDYEFWTQQTFNGRSVVAVQVVPGAGPAVVVTPDECEMRTALGLAVQTDTSLLDGHGP
jgi:hypothetical protein